MKKISVVTVVFNAKDDLEKTIKSVLSQSYKNIEYIIIDGNSTDGTIDVIKKYGGSISCFVCEPDDGIYHAMNKGIALATGYVIHLLNAGDCYENDMVITNVMTRFNNFDTKFLVGRVKYVMESGEIRLLKMTNSVDTIPHPAFFSLAEIYKKNPFDQSIKFASDVDFFMRTVNKNDVFTIEDLCVVMPAGGAGSSMQCLKETYRIYRKYSQTKKSFIVIIKIVKRYLAKFLKASSDKLQNPSLK